MSITVFCHRPFKDYSTHLHDETGNDRPGTIEWRESVPHVRPHKRKSVDVEWAITLGKQGADQVREMTM